MVATPTATRGPRKVILSRKLVGISSNEFRTASEAEAMVAVEEAAISMVVVPSWIPATIRFAKKYS
jgi:hypothetical protein